ncbi:hypothetical protein HU200_043536 [Digitaria exilis]|uniref:C2 domain-containing protein n=1 Tax=Digitaria exilis TaxID=1010633 RepID=A0A835B384_9POAL|nr:hypothetical protein HU200_043536 [Digitaria exilis]
MERSPHKRPEPAAIDITWVSCRGVRSSLPFQTPCLYASISVVTPSSSAKGVHGHRRRPHRVKTPTDRAGGANPEWDTPLRLYLPLPEVVVSPPPSSPADKKSDDDVVDDDVLVLRFEIKAEVAVLGDMLAASAAVAVRDLVPDGRTRRVSYQLVGPDGRSPNGVISFSYAFHDRNAQDNVDDGRRRSSSSSDGGELVVVSPLCPAASTTSPVAPRLYPAIEWPLVEEHVPIIYPPVTSQAAVDTVNSRYYPPPPSATPLAVYPPPPAETTVAASGMYPTVDLAPVSCYPPPVTAPLYGVECGYAAAPGWDQRCLYG